MKFYPAAHLIRAAALVCAVVLPSAGVLIATAFAYRGQPVLAVILALSALPLLGAAALMLTTLRTPDLRTRVVIDSAGIALWKRGRLFVRIPWTEPMYISYRDAVSTSKSRFWRPGEGPFHIVIGSEILPAGRLYDETQSLNYAAAPPPAGAPWRLHCCRARRARALRLVREIEAIRARNTP